MGLYAGQNIWRDEVYEYDVTDPVIGGPLGTANKPPHDLADRTVWLKNQIGRSNRFEDEVILTTNAPIPGTLAGHLIVAFATGVQNLTLEDAATFPHGAIVPIKAFCNANSVVNILTTGGQVFYNPIDGEHSVVHMHHLEDIEVIALTDHFKVRYGSGNFHCVGEEIKARKVRNNTVIMQGQLLSRSLFPRLWKYVQTLTMFQEKIEEATWNSHPTNFKGLFTEGDTVSTFRVPDERGMFERMLDLGRGIDIGRITNYAGGYEADEFKSHSHRPLNGSGGQATGPLGPGQGFSACDGQIGYINPPPAPHSNYIESTGGTETRPKNIGKLHLIKF